MREATRVWEGRMRGDGGCEVRVGEEKRSKRGEEKEVVGGGCWWVV